MKAAIKPSVRTVRRARRDSGSNPVSGTQGGCRGRRPIAPEVEARVLDMAFRSPAYGQDRIARELRASKMTISASGVRYVLQRNNLETLEKRVTWIEARLGHTATAWSEEQLAARDRAQAQQHARAVSAGIGGAQAEEALRSMRILAVAASLIRERSFEAVSLRDIARRANIPLGSIYYHFRTKEELFADVYEEGMRRLRKSLDEAVAQVVDPWARFERACATHLANLCGGDDFTAVSIPTQVPGTSPAISSRIQSLNDDYEDIFRHLVQALDIRPGLSTSLLRLQVLGALNWTTVWYQPGKISPSDIATQFVAMIRYGAAREH